MAQRTLLLFMRRDESLSLLQELCGHGQLHLIRQQNNRLEITSLTAIRAERPDVWVRVYLSDEPPGPEALSPPIQPGRRGWVQFDLPLEQGDRLYAATLGAITSWHRRGSNLVADSPRSVDLFKVVAGQARRIAAAPAVVRNIKLGGEGPTINTWCTAGAKQWVASGGLLMQEGVENTRFSPLTTRWKSDTMSSK